VRVLVGYTNLRPEVREALDRHAVPHGCEIVYEDCTPSSDHYHDTLTREWARQETFAVVEHDIVIDERVIPSFDGCPEVWCGFGYELAVGYQVCLGCTRFRAELIAEVPDLLDLVQHETQSGVPAKAWYRMDVRIGEVLKHRGYTPHLHMPPIRHLNDTNRLQDPVPVWEPVAAREEAHARL
jgi:hypothetical protein